MIRTLFLSLLGLSACAPSSVALKDADTGVPDGDADTDTDTDTDADTDTDTDTDTNDTEDTNPPEPVPDYTVWDATRSFYLDYYGYGCDDTVTESGTAVAEDSPEWQDLHDVCGLCDYFYEVTLSSDTICEGYVPLAEGWRGVILEDDAAAIYFLTEDDGEVAVYAGDENASFDGTTIEYEYEGSYGMDVWGTVTYPLVTPE